MAIEFAAKMAGGHYSNVKTAIILFTSDEGLGLMQAGEDQDGYRLIGMFEAAKMSVFADGDEE